MFTRENINNISNSIYAYLKSININVKEMYLFGSYAKGTAKEESVEIHTFRAEDLNSENNLFLNSVRKDFIKLI